jgi:hypothetical protein
MRVPALNVSDKPLAERHRIDGGFWYVGFGGDDVVGIHFICPCGCRKRAFLRFKRPGENYPASWTWDGNFENPVLTELVDMRRNCTFAGYLGKGSWTFK